MKTLTRNKVLKFIIPLLLSIATMANQKVTLSQMIEESLVDQSEIERLLDKAKQKEITPLQKKHTIELIRNNIEVIESALDEPKGFIEDRMVVSLKLEEVEKLKITLVYLSYATAGGIMAQSLYRAERTTLLETFTKKYQKRATIKIGTSTALALGAILYSSYDMNKRYNEAFDKTYDLTLTEDEESEFRTILSNMKDLLFEYNEMIKEELGLEQY